MLSNFQHLLFSILNYATSVQLSTLLVREAWFSIGLMTTIHSSLYRETLDNRVAHIGVRERGATDIRQTKMT